MHLSVVYIPALKRQGFTLRDGKTRKINKFSPESQYVLELALNAARLKQQKYIGTEHLLLGLIQLMELGNNDLAEIFHNNEVDISALAEKVKQLL